MEFTIVHQIPGRIRLRYNRYGYSRRQAMLMQMLLSLQEGIDSVTVNPETGSILLVYTGIPLTSALAFIKALGPKYLDDEELLASVTVPEAQENLFISLSSMVLRFLLKKLLPLPIRRSLLLLNVAPRIGKGIESVMAGKPFCANTLDATALGLSFASGDISTTSSINLLLNMGDVMEDYTRRKSYDNLAQSLLLRDENVQVLVDGEEKSISSRMLKAGDVIVVRAGSAISADGTVESGEGAVNQAAMTGESLPVKKEKGDSVYASTILEEGELHIKVRAAGGETRVSRIADMIDRSQDLKATSQVRAEQAADRIVPYNFLLALVTYLVTRNPTKAASTLLVDYSCAMKLSAPISVLAAMRDSAQLGIMVKGGKYLEDLAHADVFVFDKTGTLTESMPHLAEIVTFGGRDENEVLRNAACLEEHFPHSLARAVVKAAVERKLDHKEKHTKVQYVVAHGIASTLDGEELRIGSAHFIFEDEKIPMTREIRKEMDRLEKDGCSELFFAQGGELAGIIAIKDPLRKESPSTIAKLKSLGATHVVMITGDGEATARAIAWSAGIDEYISQALPDQKIALIKRYQAEGHKVVMVGDGINDSPALSAADVGIAMGQASSIARETADILLPDDGLASLPILREIGLRLADRIDGNNRLIVALNSALIAGELAGTIAPATAALVHNGSTVAISMESMRPLVEIPAP